MPHSALNNQYNNNMHVQLPGKFNVAGSTNPIAYQRFLNCDVKGFNLNLGFGGAETTMSMDLVESLEGNPPGHKADESLATFRDRCNTSIANSACTQRRYNGELGHVYTFICNDENGSKVFEYAGLLSDHDIKLDSNGRTISIRMTDGRAALENVQLIIGNNYSRNYIYDSAGNSINVLNILFEIEKGVTRNVDNLGISGLGTFNKCDYFMDSGYDEDGIPATYILGQFMSSTRYMSLPLSDQKIRINLDNVFNNAVTRAPYMRVNDTSISLMGLLQQVCDEMAGELVINMVHTAADSEGVEYEIVATFIDRSAATTVGATPLGDYLAATFPAYKSLSYGQESAYDATQNIVFGSKLRFFTEIQRATMYGTPMYSAGNIGGTEITQEPPDMSSDAVVDHDKVKAQDMPIPPTDSCVAPFGTPFTGGVCGLNTGGGRIAMVLGERLNGALTDQGIPAYTLYASNLCADYMGITYDLTEICSILGKAPADGDLTALLTEEELLFTQTYESYINWATMHPGSIGYKMGLAIFGPLWGNFQEYSLKIFADIVDNGSFDSFKDPALAFPDVEVSKKLFEVVHAYVKNIYDTYYGKEFVALLDNRTQQVSAIDDFSVCVGKSFNTWGSSDADGTFPQANANVTIPQNSVKLFFENGILSNVIKTAGNGYLSTSETVAQGAWFGSTSQSTILSLGTDTGLARFLNDDNTIGCFVKYGPVNNICKRIGNQTFVFRVDLSALNPDDFYVDGSANLYLRASVKEEMYFGSLNLGGVTASSLYGSSLASLDDDNTWVRFSIPKVKLVPTAEQEGAVSRAASRMALIALQVMTDVNSLSGVIEGDFSLRDAIADKLAGGGINPGTYDGIAANLAVTNLAKMSVPAIVPEAVAIPFQSETLTYGPWKSVTNANGGLNVVEQDLAPWQFGFGSLAPINGFTRMAAVGTAHANNAAFGRLFQEKATIDVAGIPSINIAAAVTNDASTILTDISFGFGGDGAKTSMTYQTYSPKFGTAPKYLEDTAKKTISQKLEYMKQFRTERIKNAAKSLKLKEDLSKIIVGRNISGGGGGAGVENTDGNSRYGHTPSKILMCGYLNKSKVSDITNSDGGKDGSAESQEAHDYTDGCEDIDNNPFTFNGNSSALNDGNTCNRFASAEIHPTYNFDSSQKEYYKNMSLMSMDGMYLPVSLEGGPNSNLVRYATYSTPAGLPKGRPITMMPPVNISTGGISDTTAIDLTIDQKYTNPICSKAILATWDDRKNSSDQGFVIINVAHGDDPSDNYNFDLINTSGTTGPGNLKDRQTATDFRFNAMRGPLVLQAWGYDINGKPIPNANDSALAAESGTFRSNNLEDKFLKNWLSNPKTWPVGPIDLRWDRHRGVWVSPPSSKIIPARLTSALSPFGTAEAELLNPNTFYADYPLYSPDGTEITSDVRNLTVTVHDYIGSSISKCAIVLLYYADGKYTVIEEGGTRNLQRARISSGQTLSCNGQCEGELFTVSAGGGVSYGDIGAITISDVMGIVSQPLAALTRLWVYKPPDTSNYEVVYIGSRSDADCGSCGGLGVYQIAGVDFNRLPTVQTVGKVLSVTDGGCLALVGTKDCGGIATP